VLIVKRKFLKTLQSEQKVRIQLISYNWWIGSGKNNLYADFVSDFDLSKNSENFNLPKKEFVFNTKNSENDENSVVSENKFNRKRLNSSSLTKPNHLIISTKLKTGWISSWVNMWNDFLKQKTPKLNDIAQNSIGKVEY
jgi:hypothetical protein